MSLYVRGECSRCGELVHYSTLDDDTSPANLFLTVPGRGAFRKTIYEAELVCKNAQLCAERQMDARP